MTSRMDEFREFVKRHPEVRNEVRMNKASWQQIYEDWVILGEGSINQNMNTSEPTNKTVKSDDLLSSDNIKSIIEKVKKINPDSISKTLNTVQKVLQITQSFGGRVQPGLYNANYNSWWD